MMFTMMLMSTTLMMMGGSVDAAVCDNPVSLTEGEEPPRISLNETQFASLDLLTVSVRSRMVDGRSDFSSEFEFVDPAGDTDCQPVSSWTRSLDQDNCEELWSAVYEWSVIRDKCGFVYEAGASSDIFTGTLRVTQNDELASIRGVPQYRTTQTDLGFSLQFDNEKSFTNTVGAPVVYAPILVLSAVTESKWDRADKKLSLVIYNSVQYPFSLSLPNDADVNFTHAGTSYASLKYDEDDQINCPATSSAGNPACQRTVVLELVPGLNNSCILDGLYWFEMTISCSPTLDAALCPISANNNKAIVQVYLKTDNVCGSVDLVTDESSLSLSMTTHADNTFSLPEKKGFFATQDIFVKTVMKSNRVSIAESYLREVIVDEKLLYGSDGSISANGTTAAFQIVNPANAAGGVNGFKFKPISSLFSVPEDQSRPLPIAVTVRAAYKSSSSSSLSSNKRNNMMDKVFVFKMMQNRQAALPEADKNAQIAIDLSADPSSASVSSDANKMKDAEDAASSGNALFASMVMVAMAAVLF